MARAGASLVIGNRGAKLGEEVVRAIEQAGGRAATWPDRRAQGGEGSLSENVRDEINDLRKQVAELAMERDVLTRAAAFWAKEAMGS
jgi:hypothetical protein